MIKLSIGNSYSKVEGLSPKQDKLLRDGLSYMSGDYFSGFGPQKRCLLDKRGNFPTGLLNRVTVLLKDCNPTIVDVRPLIRTPKVASISWNTMPLPYPAQLKALEAVKKFDRGTISMPTGTGKSLVIALIAKTLNLPTLIIVPSLEIKKQLLASLIDVPNVVIENIDSTTLKNHKNFDCLIIDEAHHVAAKTYRDLNKTSWTSIRLRYFLTATPFRNDTEETLLFESIAGGVIYQLTYKEAVTNGYIVPVESYYLSIPKTETNSETYPQVYRELVVRNTPRNMAICSLMSNLADANKSTLCLVREVAHGQLLSDMTGIPFVSGADDYSRQYISQFNSGLIKVLIGTTGILGEGIDTKPAEYIIVAGLGKAKSQFMQQIGRGVRKYPGKESAKVIIIRDSSHRFLLRHFNAQKKILKEEYGCIAQKIEI